MELPAALALLAPYASELPETLAPYVEAFDPDTHTPYCVLLRNGVEAEGSIVPDPRAPEKSFFLRAGRRTYAIPYTELLRVDPMPERLRMNASRQTLAAYKERLHAFVDAHGRYPTEAHFTREDEATFVDLPATTIGNHLAEKLYREGPRGAFASFFGVRVVWDAAETCVK